MEDVDTRRRPKKTWSEVIEKYCPLSPIHWGWWKWALISLDGVAPSRMVGVSASVDLSLHHKVQKFSSDTGSPGWSQKKGRKTVVVLCGVVCQLEAFSQSIKTSL